jgi:hypothetical protein
MEYEESKNQKSHDSGMTEVNCANLRHIARKKIFAMRPKSANLAYQTRSAIEKAKFRRLKA